MSVGKYIFCYIYFLQKKNHYLIAIECVLYTYLYEFMVYVYKYISIVYVYNIVT